MVETRRIQAEDTCRLRQQLLRAHQSIEQCRFPGDLDPTTMHLGAFESNELVGILSLYRVDTALLAIPNCWQLRAMAMIERVRGKGYGRRLLKDAEEYVLNQDGQGIWANARSTAVGFYQKAGYRILGEEFTIPDIGPHYVVFKRINHGDGSR